MTLLAIAFAATLSAGNAEFESVSKTGAFAIAAARERARLVSEGPSKGVLAKAMLSSPEAFVRADASKPEAWNVYRAMIEAEYGVLRKAVAERLGLAAPEAEGGFDSGDLESAKVRFEKCYAEERAMACAEQAATLVGVVRPDEADFETKDEAALKREMCAKVAAQQKTVVFEENLGYISTRIVEPVMESARKERKRQGEYLRRARSDAWAPSALERDLSEKLVLSVRERKAKSCDPTLSWGVFPSVTNVTLRNVVHRRTMGRLADKVPEIPFEVRVDDVARAVASNSAGHRKADESKKLFRQVWSQELCRRSAEATCEEAPEGERKELGEYLLAHRSDEQVSKAVNRRVEEELMPKLAEMRRELSAAEFAKTWPTLADRTWYPEAETADATCARSDYAAAIQAWRELPRIELARGEETLEETSAHADRSVAAAFETARSAIAAQTRIVDEVHPAILAAAQSEKESFWRRTPDLGRVVRMLTEAVEARWAETKVGVLWPKGDMPKNSARQHAELFPSVKKRIDLVARSIIAEINKPETKEEPEVPVMPYSIVVTREGDRVTVKLDQGGNTLAERNAKANMSDFRGAIGEVGEKLGKEILKLK